MCRLWDEKERVCRKHRSGFKEHRERESSRQCSDHLLSRGVKARRKLLTSAARCTRLIRRCLPLLYQPSTGIPPHDLSPTAPPVSRDGGEEGKSRNNRGDVHL